MWVPGVTGVGLYNPFTWFGRLQRFAKYSPAVAADRKHSCSVIGIKWFVGAFLFSVKQSLFWHVYKYVVNDIKTYLGVKCLLRKKQREVFSLKKKLNFKKITTQLIPMCGFSPRRRLFLPSPPSYRENTEFIQDSNKCSVLEEREDWQGMECRWATQIPNLSLATATIKRKSVNTETIKTVTFCYGLFFSCKENPWHPK